jgi:O-antigen/teichoic acid export membrane protein
MSSDPPAEATTASTYTRRLRTNALARFISSGSMVITGFVTATVTARWLGPADKGTLSTMLYIATICGLLASLGLGEASIVVAGGDARRLQQLMALTLPLILMATIPAVIILLAAAWIGHWSGIALAVAVACVLIPLKAIGQSLILYQHALERLVRSSLISVVQVSLEMLLLVILITVVDLEIAGAVIAAALAETTAIVLSLRALRRDHLNLRNRWSREQARSVLAMGAPLVTARLIIALATRFDLVLVYILAGLTPAGHYSIALTLGQLTAYASGALAMAAFPRLARIEDDDAWELIPRIARMGLSAALLSSVVLLPLIPLLVPILFGDDFIESITPALILVGGGILWSELTLLTRSVAALGHSAVQLTSFLVYLLVMGALDLFLIPQWGIVGAAIASVIAPIISLLGFISWYRKQARSAPFREFLPRRKDVLELLSFVKGVVKHSGSSFRHPRDILES